MKPTRTKLPKMKETPVTISALSHAMIDELLKAHEDFLTVPTPLKSTDPEAAKLRECRDSLTIAFDTYDRSFKNLSYALHQEKETTFNLSQNLTTASRQAGEASSKLQTLRNERGRILAMLANMTDHAGYKTFLVENHDPMDIGMGYTLYIEIPGKDQYAQFSLSATEGECFNQSAIPEYEFGKLNIRSQFGNTGYYIFNDKKQKPSKLRSFLAVILPPVITAAVVWMAVLYYMK